MDSVFECVAEECLSVLDRAEFVHVVGIGVVVVVVFCLRQSPSTSNFSIFFPDPDGSRADSRAEP